MHTAPQPHEQLDPSDLDAAEARDRDRARRSARAIKQAHSDLIWLMEGPRGRRFIWNILEGAELNESSYRSNHGEMCRVEGRKDLARGFLRLILQLCPEHHATMLKENNGTG